MTRRDRRLWSQFPHSPWPWLIEVMEGADLHQKIPHGFRFIGSVPKTSANYAPWSNQVGRKKSSDVIEDSAEPRDSLGEALKADGRRRDNSRSVPSLINHAISQYLALGLFSGLRGSFSRSSCTIEAG
jgi:hypothetical protein